MTDAILLDNVDTDTVSDSVVSTGGHHVVHIRGTNFGGGTVTIEIAPASDPGERYAVVTDGSFTANGDLTINYLPSGTKVRATLNGSSGANDVWVSLRGN